MSRLTEKFSRLSPGDKYRFFTTGSFFVLGAVIAVRGLAVGIFPVLMGIAFVGFGIYRFYYFYRYFRQGRSKAPHAVR